MKKQLHTFFHSKPFIYSVAFTVGLVIFEFIFLSQKYESVVLFRYFKSGVYLRPLAFIALSLLSVFLTNFFVWSALASPRKCRILYFALFCLAVMTEYGYQYAFYRFSQLEDVENAFIAADLQIKLNAAAIYFNYLSIIPCLLFGLLLLFVKPVLKQGYLILPTVLILFGGFFSLTAYFTHNNFYTVSLDSYYRTAISFPINWYVGTAFQAPRSVFYNVPREAIEFQAQNHPVNNIVFIVDESVRGDHLSLNGYARPTTSFLEELNQKGLLENWGIAVSGATCSMTSNNLLLTGLHELPDDDFKIYKLPTIFRYAKAAGYKNYYFDGQVSNLWNGKPSDVADFGEWITAANFAGVNSYEIDREIARQVREIVGKTTGNFIWINKFGVHKPYEDSYPNTNSVWLPVTESRDERTSLYSVKLDPELLKNSYDNAVAFNSQSFFSTLLGDGLAKNTFYIYTSDHGQTLSENGETASHCSNTKNEAQVPLLIVAEPGLMPEVDVNYKASHSNIFATLLDLMNFPESERKYAYTLSLFKAKAANSQPRFYFAGDLHNRSLGGLYPFD